MAKEYALYRGDEFVLIGTIKEIAEEIGVKEKTILHYKTPTYLRKIERRSDGGRESTRLVELDDEIEHENEVECI